MFSFKVQYYISKIFYTVPCAYYSIKTIIVLWTYCNVVYSAVVFVCTVMQLYEYNNIMSLTLPIKAMQFSKM